MRSGNRVGYCVIVAVLVLLTACGSPASQVASQGTTGMSATASATPSPVVTILPADTASSITPTTLSRTPAVEPSPVSGQYELAEQDSGKSFVYSVTSRFGVQLDSTKYPPDATRCTPEGVIGIISNRPAVAPPLAARRFEGVKPGRCTLRNGNWSVLIEIAGGQ